MGFDGNTEAVHGVLESNVQRVDCVQSERVDATRYSVKKFKQLEN